MKTESNLNEDETPKPKRTVKPRRTPTHKQVEALAELADEDLIEAALAALHALNRRAKEIRDRKNTYRRASFADALEIEKLEIYALKDDLLEALTLAGRATVGTFTSSAATKEVSCGTCNRTWFGGTWCHRCAKNSGEPVIKAQTWYVIDCGDGYRFHQYKVSAAVAAKAVPIPPHDPTQPQREIPDVGLTIEAQKACVELAVERLAVACANDPESDDVTEGVA